MSSVSTRAPWQKEIQVHLASLSMTQARVLALWSFGIVLTKSCGTTHVSHWLAHLLECPQGRLRQRLREWDDEAWAKRGEKRREMRGEDAFAEVFRWIIEDWQGPHRLVLALDATNLRERFTERSLRVVSRGCALPVAWHFLRANEAQGGWQDPIGALFQSLQGVIPEDWLVIVMTDRGLYAPWL